MKKLALLAAVAALSACNEKAAEAPATDAATTEAMASPTAAATMTAAEMAGTYDVKMADGTMATTMINADGTYADMDAAGKKTESGTVSMRDGQTCFDPEGDAKEVCFTDGPRAADGSWVSTAADGTKVTVMKKPA